MIQPPAQPPGPPPSQPPPGTLALTMQGNLMTSNIITPQVRLNGYVVPVSYGHNAIPLPPGRWHVDVHAQWLRQYGQASMDFDLYPGQVVPVFYAAPLHQFTTGAIGHVKQPRRGLLGFALVMTFVVAMFLLVVGLSLALRL